MRVTDLRERVAFRSNLITLSSDGAVWIQVAAAGTWKHPRYGDVVITTDDLARMFQNFKSGSHPLSPVELPVDYDHLSTQPDRKPGDGIAAGWYKDLSLRRDGRELWGLIEWTPAARKKIQDKEYRYFSPTFHPKWRDDLGVTLLGGALTNYPTLPGCVVTCSLDSGEDVAAVRVVPSHEGHTMKIKGKNDKGEIVEIEIDDKELTLDALSGVPAVKELQAKIPNGDVVIMPKGEFESLSTTMKTLSTTVDSQKTQIDALNEAKRLSDQRELGITLDALQREGRLLTHERGSFEKLATSNRELFDEMVKARKTAAPLIRLDTTQGSGGNGPDNQSAEVRMLALVDARRKDNPKLSYSEAMKEVTAENPELTQEYLNSKRLPVGRGGVLMSGFPQ